MEGRRRSAWWIAAGLAILVPLGCVGAEVVINEIAWGGTAASASDEWIELHNPTGASVDLTGWTLSFGETVIELRNATDVILEAGGYFLLERSDDGTVSDVEADIVYVGALTNSGTVIELRDAAGEVADRVDAVESGWPAGTASAGDPPYASMERVDPLSEAVEWATHDGRIRNGADADGAPLNGTPGRENSARVIALAAPRVELIAPIDEEAVLAGTVIIEWSATDPDGTAEGLRVSIEVSLDDGETWEILAANLANGGGYAWDTTLHPDGDSVRLKVTAEDGSGYRGVVESPVLTIRNGEG